MAGAIETTRGMPFKADHNAVLQRVRKQEARDKERHKTAMRAEGRRRDQVETCYRQHTPPQIRFAEGMLECPS